MTATSTSTLRTAFSGSRFWTWPLIPALAVLPACGPVVEAPESADPSAAVPTSSPASQGSADEWTLMTWNVEFLWDGDPPEDGDASFPWKGDPKAARRHMAELAERIRDVNPDILGLVEVENLRALEVFNRELLGDLGYTAHLIEGRDTATGQDVGLLSRVEVLSMDRDPRRGLSGSARKSLSKNYVARLQLADKPVGILGLHLLARPERRNRVEPRQAQAEAAAGIARDLAGQGRSVIVWGDFNDYDGTVADHDDSRPITRVLEIIRAMDPRDPDDDLVNVMERLPKNKRYTVTFGRRDNRRRTAIDHLLLSPDLAAGIQSVEIPHGGEWKKASDHYPVIVRLKL